VQKPNKYTYLFFAIFLIAMALRLPQLTQRPMHTDEAVHAIKFGSLLEQGEYKYDKHEYHGPTLNYITLIPAWFQSSQKLSEINETTLRIVPVFFGLLLILLLILLKDELGKAAFLFTALFIAISPALTYFSRYYIQEMLLVCFTLGAIAAGFRYLKTKKVGWILLTGLFLGLMHATKETSILTLGAFFFSIILTSILNKNKEKHFLTLNLIKTHHLIVMGIIAIIISGLFYSSFLTNLPGVLDSFKTYTTYIHRAGQNEIHIHPWYFYIQRLIFYKVGSGPIWSEALIVCFGIIGIILVFTKKHLYEGNIQLYRFIAFYTIILTLIYSIIPYKTPWSMLSFFLGIILMAGLGAVYIFRTSSKFFIRIVIILLVTFGSIHLLWQAYAASNKYSTDVSNPYVYAHTSNDIFEITDRIKEVALASPNGNDSYIEVICPGDDYWPLPWYLRSFPNIGWWNEVNFEIPASPIIVATPDVEEDVLHKLYFIPPPGEKNLYLPLFDSYIELRPLVELRGYVSKELWDSYQSASESEK
jgi:uncharacterized protein (TIGR03663 family)